MTKNETTEHDAREPDDNQFADAISAVLIVVIPVVAVIYYLSGLPTS